MSGVTVRLFDLDMDAAALERCRAVLGGEELARAESILDATARRRFVAAHGLLRRSLAKLLDRHPAALEIAVSPFGKPMLAENVRPRALHFSLSHAGPLMALAWRFGGPLGVDIEDCRRLATRDLDPIIEHAMNRQEQNFLRRYPAARRARAFYKLWTRKEALAKAVGRGFSIAPAEISADGNRGWRGVTVRDLALPPGFAGAIAA